MKILKAIFHILAILPTIWTIYFIALVSRYWIKLGHIPSCYGQKDVDLQPEQGWIFQSSTFLLMIAFYVTPISLLLFGILKFKEEKISTKITLLGALSLMFMLCNIFVYNNVFCWYMD